jgi:hypothetical protein
MTQSADLVCPTGKNYWTCFHSLNVCALAVAADADYLFTHDRGYLREGLGRFGVEVLVPDQFLGPAFDADTRGMLDILELQANSWEGGRSIEDLLAAIERAGAAR